MKLRRLFQLLQLLPAAAAAPKPLDAHATLLNTIHSLTRQLSTTHHSSSRTLILSSIAAHTPLYHARHTDDLPPSPDWLALDAGMSLGIMSTRIAAVQMLTYTTTRPLRLLMFSGISAALGPGWLDSQLLFLYNTTTGPLPPDLIGGEYTRARELCAWATAHDTRLDGFIRGNAGLEVIICDFATPALRLLGSRNVTAPDPPRENPTIWFGPSGILHWRPPARGEHAAMEWVRAAAAWNVRPDTRVAVDYCALWTFPPDATAADAAAVRARIGAGLREPQPCTRVDWRNVVDTLVARYRPLLASAAAAVDGAAGVALRFRPDDGGMLRRCVREFTGHLPVLPADAPEAEIVAAVEGVLGEICALLLGPRVADEAEVARVREWLDWADDTEGACERGEVWMAAPVWPLLEPRGGGDEWLGKEGRWSGCVGVEYFRERAGTEEEYRKQEL
ncbi:hypothetical protein EDC01DRAFT_732873 [Geopyxis carbonaria]|nr:hypothetical protein EDC01DRAFT_732873 [Geopyxis carbonaria]